jgi:hypothetical protein
MPFSAEPYGIRARKLLNETAISFDRSVVIAHNEAIVNRFGIAPISLKTFQFFLAHLACAETYSDATFQAERTYP